MAAVLSMCVVPYMCAGVLRVFHMPIAIMVSWGRVLRVLACAAWFIG
jgi:hypothetical protein